MSTKLHKLSLYFHTLRYLKWQQVYYRIYYRLRTVKVKHLPHPTISETALLWENLASIPSHIDDDLNATFLNESHAISNKTIWQDKTKSHLWLYILHYFDEAKAKPVNAELVNGLINRWVLENPTCLGVGWEPYPTSLRIVNWIKWQLLGHELSSPALDSLATQVRMLMQKLEYHLLGNHLFANAKALVFAGLFFQGDEASQWYQTGMKILEHEIQEQVLADGGHFELSPMYHSIILEDILDLIQLHQIYQKPIPKYMQDNIPRMLNWLFTLSHPDGEIAFFNDAAIGIAQPWHVLAHYAQDLQLIDNLPAVSQNQAMQNSGYYRMEKYNVVLLIDAAAVGPDYLPGHAHADNLSFELSQAKQRVIVNSGTYCYGDHPVRFLNRKTRSHNTVVLDDEDSSEVWGSFRVARRASTKLLDYDAVKQYLRASHDGYRRLGDNIIHTRSWQLCEKQLELIDEITGQGEHNICLCFHFHPNVVIQSKTQLNFELQHPQGTMTMTIPEGFKVDRIDSEYYPEFGKAIPNQSLILTRSCTLPINISCILSWN